MSIDLRGTEARWEMESRGMTGWGVVGGRGSKRLQ